MSDDVLKMYDANDLRPAQTTDRPAVGDRVEFWLTDGGAGAIGHVLAVLGEGWVKVGVEGIGNFLVAPGRTTVIARAN